MSVYYVYILETTSKEGITKYYTGYTNNLFKRWSEHRSGIGGAKFCRGKKQILLKYFETYMNRTEAMKRELEIKSFSRKKKEDLINRFNENVKS